MFWLFVVEFWCYGFKLSYVLYFLLQCIVFCHVLRRLYFILKYRFVLRLFITFLMHWRRLRFILYLNTSVTVVGHVDELTIIHNVFNNKTEVSCLRQLGNMISSVLIRIHLLCDNKKTRRSDKNRFPLSLMNWN